MAEPVRVALLGAGRIVQRVHLDLLRRLPGVRVVSVAEADLERLARAGQTVPRARRTVDWREALAAPDVEAAMICLPNPLHGLAAEAAFERRLHVYLEKPIATSLIEGERVVAAWRRSGRVGMIGFNYRHQPANVKARAWLATEGPGRLVAVRTVFSTPARELPEWQQARGTGGGVLLNLGVHHADLVPFLTGSRFRRLSAHLRSVNADQDTAIVQGELESGVPVQMLFSMSAAPADCIELIGERGTLVVDRLGAGEVHLETADAAASPRGDARAELGATRRVVRRAVHAWRGRPEPSFAAAFATFVTAVREGNDEFPDMQAGLDALRVLDAAERSAAAGGAAVEVIP